MNRLRLVVVAAAPLGLVLLTVSCGTLRTPRAGEAVMVPVFYATDRTPLMPLDQWQVKLRKKGSHFAYYGAEYDPSRLELGVCPISVPALLHRAGVVERPGWPSSAEDPAKHFSITALTPSEPEAFFAGLNDRVTHSGCREVFIFVHGYNMTFASAALYTAQLAWDWGFKGVPILYSWPSDGTLLAYPKDEESARLTESHLRVFCKRPARCMVPAAVWLV
jgi:esterase/lipase superfamily enzyme